MTETDETIGIALTIAIAEIEADHHATLGIINGVHIGIGIENETAAAGEMIEMPVAVIEIETLDTEMMGDRAEKRATGQMFRL